MLLFTLGLNACVAAGVFIVPISELRTLLLISVLIVIEFVILKQFRAACAMLCWLWFYVQHRFVPQAIIPDTFGLFSVATILVGLWVGLGVERNQNEGRIRPGLIVVTFALYFLPFQTRFDHPVVCSLLSVWFFSVYTITCWIKDHLEEDIVTVFYFIVSSYWVLLADLHWTLLIARVAYTALLCRAALPILGIFQEGGGVAGQIMPVAKHSVPETRTTKRSSSVKQSRISNGSGSSRPFRSKKEFTLKDGFHLGLKLLQEDELISAMIDERTRGRHERHQLQFQQQSQTIIPSDDPVVLENEQKYAI